MAKLWAHVTGSAARCPAPSAPISSRPSTTSSPARRPRSPRTVRHVPRRWPSPWIAAAAEQRAHLGPAGLQATRAAGADAPSVGEHDVFLAEPTQAGAPVPDAPLNETTPAPMSAPAFDWPSTHEQPQIADQAPPPPPTPPPSERAAAVAPRGPGRPPQQGGRSRLLIALGLVAVIVVAAAAFLVHGAATAPTRRRRRRPWSRPSSRRTSPGSRSPTCRSGVSTPRRRRWTARSGCSAASRPRRRAPPRRSFDPATEQVVDRARAARARCTTSRP